MGLPVLLLLGLAPAVPRASAATLQLPDLHPRPVYTVQVNTADDDVTPWRALRFAVATENVGEHALDVTGEQHDGSQAAAMQCVEWNGALCLRRQQRGTFTFHAEHGHWHLVDYGRYELRELTSRGRPDMRTRGLVAGGQKVSFCLQDSESIRYQDGIFQGVTGEPLDFAADPFGYMPFYMTCTGLQQGIGDGFADVYGPSLPGQQIVIDGVPDGDYAVVVTVNPLGTLLETDYSNNTSFQNIRLTTAADGSRSATVLSTSG